MAYYESPKKMFEERADKFKKTADAEYAMAKQGEGNYHYGKAKKCYDEAKRNKELADKAPSEWGGKWKNKD